MIVNQNTEGTQGPNHQKISIIRVIKTAEAEKRDQSIVAEGGPGQHLLRLSAAKELGCPQGDLTSVNQIIEGAHGRNL